jgi:hypothetical protein
MNKINFLYKKHLSELSKNRKKIIWLETLRRDTYSKAIIPLDLLKLTDADKRFLIEIYNNAEELISAARSLNHTERFYAVRFQLLRELCEQNGLLTEYCNIAANGKKDINDPPTYDLQLNILRHERDDALEKAKFWEDKYYELQLKSNGDSK